MSKMSKSPGSPGNAVFFKTLSAVSEVKSGYLYKSPPQKRLLVEKSWKKRFFVLFKISEDYHKLTYFRSADDRKESLGDINLSQVSTLQRNPQHQPKWDWVQKTFKCAPSCALYTKVDDRDFFLIGETSEEMDGWFSVLFDALKNRSFKFLSPTELSNGELKIEDISNPLPKKKALKVLSSPLMRKKVLSPPPMPAMPDTKPRSLSVPDVPIIRVEMDQRPVSYPYRPNQSEDLSICSLTIKEENRANNNESSESLYESMHDLNQKKEARRNTDGEVYVRPGSLLKSVNEAFEKIMRESSSPPSTEYEKYASDCEKSQHSSASSRSSGSASSSIESLKNFPSEKPNPSESISTDASEEKDIEVNTADLKKHLTLEMDGKPRVSSWTGLQQHTLGLFLKGDQILAVNDLHTVSRDEFNMLVSKSLKDKVKVTILRLSGGLRDSGNNS